MLIIGLNGSPDSKGNTAYLLEKALEEARLLGAETELIHCSRALRDLKSPFCLNCS
ncbi:MAG: flavodoxin family protein, partial [Syntrophomonadaceae bacterium]|nr:flavodoxin family protein [Syntrophomonadaceae bacterium]